MDGHLDSPCVVKCRGKVFFVTWICAALGLFFAFELVFLDQNGSGTVPDGFGTVPEYSS